MLIFVTALFDLWWIIPFSMTMLIVILYNLLNLLLDRYKHRINNVLLVLILFTVYFLYAYPMLSGAIFSAPPSVPWDTKLKTSFIDIPRYYHIISDYFRGDSLNYNTLSLPLLFTGHIASNKPVYWRNGEYRKTLRFFNL